MGALSGQGLGVARSQRREGSPRAVRAWPPAWPCPSGPPGRQWLRGQGRVRSLSGELTFEDMAADEATVRRAYQRFASTMIELSRHAPLVLAVEDLHWADASTLELFVYPVLYATWKWRFHWRLYRRETFATGLIRGADYG